MWREIQLKHFCAARCFSVVLIRLPNNDEHDTDNEMLLLFSYATVTPGLLSRMSALDELSVALTCRFSHIFSEAQQDFPKALDDGTMPVLELEDLA